ncbi:MAG: hypothetical protein NTV87_06475, partial [Ignavibacteriae bacterium]|nr:hypothetical protein [Ignavibacteriota bacterium]
MKKYFALLILILLFCSSDVYTQQEKGSYGIFSGVSLNTNSFNYSFGSTFMDTSFTNDIKPAFNIGAFLTYDIIENFSIKLVGQYTNKGGYT